MAKDYIVKDIGLADYGGRKSRSPRRRCRADGGSAKEYGAAQPLKGAKIAGSLHMKIQTAC